LVYDPAFLEHKDAVGVDDASDPLGDDDDSRSGRLFAQPSADTRFGAVVKCGEAVVEQQDPRCADDRAGDREPLALTAREIASSLGNLGVEPLRPFLDELARLSDARRALYERIIKMFPCRM
jgi:hypothetical protein